MIWFNRPASPSIWKSQEFAVPRELFRTPNSKPPLMPDPRINLKNRKLAAFLAFLIPGAGHWYQGRRFKAAIYSVCVLGTFFWGQSLAEWKGVYFRWHDLEGRDRFRTKERTIGYLSQVLVGLPALPALVQWKRYCSSTLDGLDFSKLEAPIDAPFVGYAKVETGTEVWSGPVRGQLKLATEDDGRGFGPEVRGHFVGKFEGDPPRDLDFDVAGPLTIAPRILGSGNVRITLDGENHPNEFSSSRRYVRCRIVMPRGEFESPVGEIEGTIPRRFWDWYQVPLEDEAVNELNRRLGKRYEVALLFTWVAGLLNLLAIWDAYDGPAYGYGDELEQPESKPNKVPAPKPVASVSATGSATTTPSSGS